MRKNIFDEIMRFVDLAGLFSRHARKHGEPLHENDIEPVTQFAMANRNDADTIRLYLDDAGVPEARQHYRKEWQEEDSARLVAWVRGGCKIKPRIAHAGMTLAEAMAMEPSALPQTDDEVLPCAERD